MAFKVRLARHGSKGRPFYWIMAADARSPRETGKEKLGTYNPFLEMGDPKRLVLKTERIQYWLSCGAQPTDRVHTLLSQANLLPAPVRRGNPIQSAPKKKALARLAAEAKAVEAAKAAAEAAIVAAEAAKVAAAAAEAEEKQAALAAELDAKSSEFAAASEAEPSQTEEGVSTE